MQSPQALIWVDSHVAAAAEFPREASKLTLLHVVAQPVWMPLIAN